MKLSGANELMRPHTECARRSATGHESCSGKRDAGSPAFHHSSQYSITTPPRPSPTGEYREALPDREAGVATELTGGDRLRGVE